MLGVSGTQSTSQDTKRRFRAAVNAVMSVRLVSKRGVCIYSPVHVQN